MNRAISKGSEQVAKKPEVKCPHCEERGDRDYMTKIKSRYWHPECIVAQREDNIVLKDAPVNTQGSTPEQEYRELISYICNKYNIDRPTGQILKQIKSFKEDFEYRYKGMELALRYFFDIEENSVKDDTGIGIVPYVYDRAKRFHAKKIEITNSFTDEEPEVRVFKSRRPESKRGKKQINMDEL